MGLVPPETLAQAAGLLHGLHARDITLATAESCTGGLVAAVVTAIPGSSATLLAGFVTYSNEAKMRMLGIPAETLERVGAVSEAVARGMAEGALRESGAGLALSTTGIAGPGGGSAEKPVGLVFIGAALRDGPSLVRRCVFPGDRDAVRAATVVAALDLAVEVVGLDSAVASKPGR